MDTVLWHAQPIDSVLDSVKSSADGLSDDEAARRLQQFGRNRLPPPQRASAFHILLDQLHSIVVVLLIVATAVSVMLGDLLEAAAIAAVLIINTLIASLWSCAPGVPWSPSSGSMFPLHQLYAPVNSATKARIVAAGLGRGVVTVRVVPLASRDWAVVVITAALPAVVGQTLKASRPRDTAVAMGD